MRLRRRTRPLYCTTNIRMSSTTIATMTMMAITWETSSPGRTSYYGRRPLPGVRVHVEGGLGESSHREFVGPQAPGSHERAPRGRVVEHPPQRVTERGGVVGPEHDRLALG